MLLWQSGRYFCGNPVDAFVAIWSMLLWQSGRYFCGNPADAFVVIRSMLLWLFSLCFYGSGGAAVTLEHRIRGRHGHLLRGRPTGCPRRRISNTDIRRD